MRAALFKSPGARLEIGTVPDPIPGPGEVIVRVKACGICGSDLHAAGSRNLKMPVDTIMGHEFAGVIEEVGEGVKGFERGDAIASMAFVACGQCPMCAAEAGVRCFAPRAIGFGEVPGAFAEFVKVRPGAIFKLPPSLSTRLGATVEPLVAGLHALHRAHFQAGETCLIMGAGSLGLAMLLWARYAGARTVVVSEVLMERRDLALKLGADAAVDPRMHTGVVAMTRLTGSPPDVIFECIGAPGTLAQAISLAPRGGRVVVLGAAMEDDGFPPAIALSRELDIHFSLGLEPGEAETTIAALASGRIAAEQIISRTVSLDELPRALAALNDSGIPGKLMLEL